MVLHVHGQASRSMVFKILSCKHQACGHRAGSLPGLLQAGQDAAFSGDVQPVPGLEHCFLVDLVAAQGRAYAWGAQEHGRVAVYNKNIYPQGISVLPQQCAGAGDRTANN